MKKLLAITLLLAATHAHAAAFELDATGIKESCKAEWPKNYTMQAFCIDTERKAVDRLKRKLPAVNSDGELKSILLSCWKQWEGDFSMTLFCYENQEAAYHELKEAEVSAPTIDKPNSYTVQY